MGVAQLRALMDPIRYFLLLHQPEAAEEAVQLQVTLAVQVVAVRDADCCLETTQPVALELQTKDMQAVLDGEIQTLQTNLLVVAVAPVRVGETEVLRLEAPVVTE